MRERAETTARKYGLLPGGWEKLPTKNCLRLVDKDGQSVGVAVINNDATVFEIVRVVREACHQAKSYIERYRYA